MSRPTRLIYFKSPRQNNQRWGSAENLSAYFCKTSICVGLGVNSNADPGNVVKLFQVVHVLDSFVQSRTWAWASCEEKSRDPDLAFHIGRPKNLAAALWQFKLLERWSSKLDPSICLSGFILLDLIPLPTAVAGRQQHHQRKPIGKCRIIHSKSPVVRVPAIRQASISMTPANTIVTIQQTVKLGSEVTATAGCST